MSRLTQILVCQNLTPCHTETLHMKVKTYYQVVQLHLKKIFVQKKDYDTCHWPIQHFFQSLDYDVCENMVYQKDCKSHSSRVSLFEVDFTSSLYVVIT